MEFWSQNIKNDSADAAGSIQGCGVCKAAGSILSTVVFLENKPRRAELERYVFVNI